MVAAALLQGASSCIVVVQLAKVWKNVGRLQILFGQILALAFLGYLPACILAPGNRKLIDRAAGCCCCLETFYDVVLLDFCGRTIVLLLHLQRNMWPIGYQTFTHLIRVDKSVTGFSGLIHE